MHEVRMQRKILHAAPLSAAFIWITQEKVI